MEFIKTSHTDLPAAFREPFRKPVVTIGIFDGVHRGHRKILRYIIRTARAARHPSMVLTFSPHPQQVIPGGSHPPLLLPLEERVRIMGDLGVDFVVCVDFSREFARLSPEAFVGEFLVPGLDPLEVCVGPNFTFGYGAKGHPGDLRRLGRDHGFPVTIIDTQKFGSTTVSSSIIRRFVASGDVKKARHLLGYPYYVTGIVVTGTGRGRALGYPTANIESRWDILLREGVYGARVWVKDKAHIGAVNLGTNPTFGAGRRTLEVHILDFSRSLYGESVKVEFLTRVRDEKKFSSAEELVVQIGRDVREVRRAVGRMP